MRRPRDHLRGALDADNMRRQLSPDPGAIAVEHRQGEALADRMPVAARGDEADSPPVPPDRLIAAGVGADRVDFERRDSPPRAVSLFVQGRFAPDEIALVEGDPLVEAGHARRVVLGEFARPDAEALFEAKRANRVEPIFDRAKPPARSEERR